MSLRAILIAGAAFIPVSISAQQPVPVPSAAQPPFASVDQAFADFRAKTPVPGMVYGVVVDGKLAHLGVHGQREVASKAPVAADTRFRIASMSKAFTALAILSLRD